MTTKPEAPQYLFTYGTLRPAGGKSMRGLEHVKTTSLIGAQIFNLGWFPGLLMVPTRNFVVVGDLMQIDPDRYDEVLTSCDAYEGCNNNSTDSLYHRLSVTTSCGERTWVYTYNGDMSHRPLIETGDWFKQNG